MSRDTLDSTRYHFRRRFHLAPLIPSDYEGDTGHPEPGVFRVGTYSEGTETLAASLPEHAEFFITESGQKIPEWAAEVEDRLDTICGHVTGKVIYRVPGDDTVHAMAFAEAYHVDPDGPFDSLFYVRPESCFDSVDNSRLVSPASESRHDQLLEGWFSADDHYLGPEWFYPNACVVLAGVAAFPCPDLLS